MENIRIRNPWGSVVGGVNIIPSEVDLEFFFLSLTTILDYARDNTEFDLIPVFPKNND